MNPFMNCLKITKSVPSFNSIPFSSWIFASISLYSKRSGIPARKDEPHWEISEKHARIYCSGTIYPSPVMILPVVARWDAFFCRFLHGLRTISGAIDIRSREAGWSCPLMQRNQCLEGWLLMMCKSCGKKCPSVMYPFNSLILLNLWKRCIK